MGVVKKRDDQIHKLFVGNKTYYVRPEKVEVVKKSNHKIKIEKCFFQGREYKIKGRYKNEIWHFFSNKSINENEEIFIDFKKIDLIYFDPVCKNFFK